MCGDKTKPRTWQDVTFGEAISFVKTRNGAQFLAMQIVRMLREIGAHILSEKGSA